MALKFTKGRTIILSSFILVLSIALGYLVWRVNQKETTAPGESEAGEVMCCCPDDVENGVPGCYVKCICDYGNSCGEAIPECGEEWNCYKGSDCNGVVTCTWPEVAFCNYGKCTCKSGSNGCTSDNHCVPSCDGELYDPPCASGEDVSCSGQCSGCNNAYEYNSCCRKTPQPICGDGTKDTGEECDNGGNNGKICTPTYGSSCTYCSTVCKTETVLGDYCGDKKITSPEECEPQATPTGCASGKVCNALCNCETPPATCGDGKINGIGEECEPIGSVCTKDSKPGVCSSSCKCTLDPYCGDGKLDTNDECEVGDPTGTQCSWSVCNQTACTCLPAGLNISKTVVESCIAEGTENPSSQLVYTITVRNTGSGNGQISKIEDLLDSKILAQGITPTDIVGGGIYSAGKILWSFSPALDIASGATQTYSYKILIDKTNFGTYANTVSLTPVSGDQIQANASIQADCVAAVPQTGIFDSTLGRISVGVILLLIGGVVYNLPSGIFIPRSKEKIYRYRRRFENRVSDR